MRDDETMMMVYHNRFVQGKRTSYDLTCVDLSETSMFIMERTCLCKNFYTKIGMYHFTQLSRDCG